MLKVKIVDARTASSLDPGRPNKQDVYVEYEVEGRRGYWITVPKEASSSEDIVTAVKGAEQERQAILALEIEV